MTIVLTLAIVSLVLIALVDYQSNRIVYRPGGYCFTKLLKVSNPPNIPMAVVTPPLVMTFLD